MKVLITPLNWGLGHATRDIPVIRALLAKGAEVIIASDGAALSLLRSEFPELKTYELTGWNVRYQKRGSFILKMLLQLGKIKKAIRTEHLELERIIQTEKIDVVISDNRYGCYNSSVKSVLMIHQLHIPTPVFKKALNRFNQRMIARFDEVWIVDQPAPDNLAGELSLQNEVEVKQRHIGIISRFEMNPGLEVDILVMLSGPEPQRTLLEEELIPKLKRLNRNVVMLQAKPDSPQEVKIDENITIYNHLPGSEIEALLSSAKLVISRSGYTTVMDLVKLVKPAILIPTPGQPEQEYLARYFQEKGWFVIQKQGAVDVKESIPQVGKFGLPGLKSSGLLQKAIESLFTA